LLLPAAILLAFALKRIAARSATLAVLAALVVICEQIVSIPMHDKFSFRRRAESVAAKVETGCSSFFFSPPTLGWTPVLAHQAAMWASLEANVPTVNGSSGLVPPGWALFEPRMSTPMDAGRLSVALGDWIRLNGLSARSVCWIRPGPEANDFVTMRAELP
jgi:hypothetical protein